MTLYQTLTSHLYGIPDGLFGLVPQPAEQSRNPLVSTDGQSPLDLIHNAFVATPREMSQPLRFHTDGYDGSRVSRGSPEPPPRP